jgi:SAM-dependent methyltransferase
MYCIREDYVHREEGDYDYEENITDDWQGEVYVAANEIVRSEKYTSVLDVGCGRGFKLVKHFSDMKTLGLDLRPTVEWLTENYPAHNWQVIDPEHPPQGYDLLVCADVIEHVKDPDALLEFIKGASPKKIVISTPDRNLLDELFYKWYLQKDPAWTGFNGPPFNRCHLREWSFAEFNNYISAHFEIERHFHACREKACQCIVAHARK